ncbi:MAG: hypothetical protein ACOCYZ_00455 [Halococcoides sp.]
MGAVMDLVQRDLQQAVDDIEARNDERSDDQPSLRVADVEVEVPFGVEQSDTGDDGDGDDGEDGGDEDGNGGQGGGGGFPGGGLGGLPGGGGASDGSDGGSTGLNIVPGESGGSFRLQLSPGGKLPTRSGDSDSQDTDRTPASPVPGLTWSDLGARLDPAVLDGLQDAVERGDLTPVDDGGSNDEDGSDDSEDQTYDHPILLPENGGGGSTDSDSDPESDRRSRWSRRPVRDVKGVGDRLEARLANSDIERVGDLATASPGPLAERVDLSRERARHLVGRARMMELGATSDDAAVLATVEIDVEDIADQRPSRLARLLEERAAEDLPVRLPEEYRPDLDRLERVVERARDWY